jgi:hypothetical protein
MMMMTQHAIPISDVIPAQAGIHAGTDPYAGCRGEPRTWIPAFAGMTPWLFGTIGAQP